MRAKTCKTCPWLRDADPAALSMDDASKIVSAVRLGKSVGCHCQKDDETIRYSLLEPQDRCRGALISVRGGDDTVMSTEEMLNHYTQDKATAWPHLKAS